MSAVVSFADTGLPALVDRASRALAGARSSAEVLEARDMASAAYDAAKKAARFAKAKNAHDELIARVHRAQADALEIEAGAKRRLADEYDASQERGEVASQGKPVNLPDGNVLPTAKDLGLTPKDIHEARTIRDAEVADPGVVRRALDERLAAREEPTKADLRRTLAEAAMRGLRGGNGAPNRRNPEYRPNPNRDATLTVVDSCQRLAETVGRLGAPALISGFYDAAERSRGIADMRRALAAVEALLEAADAH
jgi:hypothetical protein